ncbi:sensor histidine kinase [Derxia lacustris]|uniref:sensor histidine kinase n=1 Tax=Derxia lacustris TaxID=764842 RepID=UPI000A16CC53|nr:PAS domain S-box protein [Derxia lacustris]
MSTTAPPAASPLPATGASAARAPGSRLRHWLPPLLAGLLLLVTAAGVLWLNWRGEVSHRMEVQVADTLWVKQSLEFQLRHHEETLRELATGWRQGRVGPTEFAAKARSMLATNHELVRIALYDGDGQAVAIEETRALDAGAIETELSTYARRRGSELYAGPNDIGGQQLLTLAVPAVGKREGTLVLEASLDGLLQEVVPWWFARNNEVALANSFGDPLAVRRATSPARGNYRHQTPLEMPGVALTLVTDSTEDTPRLLPSLMSASVVGLSLTLLASLVLLWRDNTRRADAERRLSEQLSFRQAMDNSLMTGLRARDLSGRVTYVNPAFCKMVGYAPEELLGRSWPMPYHDPERDRVSRARFAQVLDGTLPASEFESVFVHRDGRRVHVLIHEAPLIDARGRRTGWMSSVHDITERRRVEELSRQQQEKLQATARLVTMGEVASTLSHELNQPLSAITAYATGCLNLVPEDEGDGEFSLRSTLEKIQRQAARAGQIIRSVHDFVRRREPAKTRCRIEEVIDATLPLVQMQARKLGIAVETRIAAELPTIDADPVMLEQVLLNLARNAMEAMAPMPAPRRKLEIAAEPRDAGIELAVVDHGPGIAPADAERLFTPFFSTKAEGMGMGLNICRTAIEFHRGRIWHEATAGGGTTFRFTLQP